ncbi:MAG: hypothetical protein ACP5O8_03810 [Candidatus Aenigmatarchaeota archaeon]
MKALSKLKSQSAILPIFTIVLIGSLTAYSIENLSLMNNSEVIPEENQTVETKKVEIFLTEPQKITRGEQLALRAEVKANSEVKNLKIFWQVPEGFEVSEKEKDCGNLEANSYCVSQITLYSSFLTKLGENEVRVLVSYE